MIPFLKINQTLQSACETVLAKSSVLAQSCYRKSTKINKQDHVSNNFLPLICRSSAHLQFHTHKTDHYTTSAIPTLICSDQVGTTVTLNSESHNLESGFKTLLQHHRVFAFFLITDNHVHVLNDRDEQKYKYN